MHKSTQIPTPSKPGGRTPQWAPPSPPAARTPGPPGRGGRRAERAAAIACRGQEQAGRRQASSVAPLPRSQYLERGQASRRIAGPPVSLPSLIRQLFTIRKDLPSAPSLPTPHVGLRRRASERAHSGGPDTDHPGLGAYH
ncbi:hypothetical protein RhiJN_12869 [Ceratobasidium sp. AG-Ba]|nr:hypothetical protein RhiJN_12869 [Ceratobasidium sp. AG-Ba]